MKRKERLFLSLSLVAGMALSACGGAAQEAKDSASQARRRQKQKRQGKQKRQQMEPEQWITLKKLLFLRAL